MKDYLQNTFYLLSLVRLDTDEIETLLGYLNKLVNTTTSLMKTDFQKLTGSFVQNQEFINENSITEKMLTEIINEHLRALLANTDELKSLHNGYDSVYLNAKHKAVNIDDEETISALLNQISEYPTFEQTMISRSLFSLAEVSEEALKKRIFDFILDIPLEELGEGSFLLYSLDLEMYDLKIMDTEFITRLENHFTELESSNTYEPSRYDFNKKLNYLHNEKKLDKYKNTSEIAKKLSDKMSEAMSNFSLSR